MALINASFLISDNDGLIPRLYFTSFKQCFIHSYLAVLRMSISFFKLGNKSFLFEYFISLTVEGNFFYRFKNCHQVSIIVPRWRFVYIISFMCFAISVVITIFAQ